MRGATDCPVLHQSVCGGVDRGLLSSDGTEREREGGREGGQLTLRAHSQERSWISLPRRHRGSSIYDVPIVRDRVGAANNCKYYCQLLLCTGGLCDKWEILKNFADVICEMSSAPCTACRKFQRPDTGTGMGAVSSLSTKAQVCQASDSGGFENQGLFTSQYPMICNRKVLPGIPRAAFNDGFKHDTRANQCHI